MDSCPSQFSSSRNIGTWLLNLVNAVAKTTVAPSAGANKSYWKTTAKSHFHKYTQAGT